MGNNLLELNFPLNDEYINERQLSLMELKSQLKDDKLLDDFYKLIIENYHYTETFLY